VATNITRTVRDDVADALNALDAAAREIEHWRAHLARAAADPEPGVAMQARRSSQVVAGVVADAVAHTADAARRATDAQLKSVS